MEESKSSYPSFQVCFDGLQLCRFVEIKEITIRNARGRSRHSVIIQHNLEARESYVNTDKLSEVTLTCGRYVPQLCPFVILYAESLSLVELECPQTQLYVSRSEKAQKNSPVSLVIRSDAGEGAKITVPLPFGEMIAPPPITC